MVPNGRPFPPAQMLRVRCQEPTSGVFFMHYRALFMALLSLSLLMGGCTATYIPISWGMGEKVQSLSRSDLLLAILYQRYDPNRKTLAVSGSSFNEVMMPSEVKHHLGAYRFDTKLIYRNMFQEYTDQQLRDLMVHELAHHIWYGNMTSQQRLDWGVHLDENPTPLRDMVRRNYRRPAEHATEDFAFTLEYAREVDIEELARMQILTDEERDKVLKAMKMAKHPQIAPANPAAVASGDKVPKAEPTAPANPAAVASGDKVSKAEPAVSANPAAATSGDKVSKAEPIAAANPAAVSPPDKVSKAEPATTH